MMYVLIVPVALVIFIAFSYVIGSRSPLDKERRKYRAGITLFQTRDYDAAFTWFDAAIRQDRRSCIPYLYRGKCHLRNENLNSALYDLTQALTYDNSLADAYVERGRVYLAMHNIERAHEDFDRAFLYSFGRDPVVLRYRGMTFLQKHLYFQAAKDLRKAAELGDEDACHQLMQPPFHGFWMNSTFRA